MPFMFSAMEIMFPIVFTLILLVFVVALIRGFSTWHKNNQSPRLTVEALVVAKREDTIHHANQNGGHFDTYYYATFQVESGDRMEFSLSGLEYGMLAEGDEGRLTFQGTRFLSFERDY